VGISKTGPSGTDPAARAAASPAGAVRVGPTDAPPAGTPGAIRRRLPYLRAALPAAAVLLTLAVPAGAVARGAAGAAGAAAGVALVVLSFLVSGFSVAWADAVHPRLIMPVGLVTYVTKIVVLGVVMWLVAATGWAGLAPMGVAIIAGVVVWTGAHLLWAVRAPLPYVIPDAARSGVDRQ
jgi:ATP synthase protein I